MGVYRVPEEAGAVTAPYDPFGARAVLSLPDRNVTYYRLAAVSDHSPVGFDRVPVTVKVLLENVLRSVRAGRATPEDALLLASWQPGGGAGREFPFFPARVLLQDLTGVPVLVDLAAMRAAGARLGGDARRVNPVVPADLVIDHSVQVDFFGTATALLRNVEKEYERNQERYALFRWAQQAFDNLRIVPPGTGIVHQVTLEALAPVVWRRAVEGEVVAFPDTLVGTDSHTPMVNALGVLGWGVGGIEAEAVLLGHPLSLRVPEIVGVRLLGQMPEGSTATDLVLTLTRCSAGWGSSAPSWSSSGRGSGRFLFPTGPRSPTWPRSTGPRRRSSPSTPPPSSTCGSRAAARPRSPWWSATPRPRGCSGWRGARSLSATAWWSSTCPPWSRAWPARAAPRTGSRWPTRSGASGRPSPRPPSARSRSTSAGHPCGWRTAPWPSPPSRAAPTPRTPPSWWRPACWPRRPWRGGSRWPRGSRRASRPAQPW